MTDPRDEARETLPHNLEAEQALLGTVLFDNAVLSRLGAVLTAEHFHEPFHGRLWGMIVDKVSEGRLADPTLLQDALADDPAFNAYGGLAYLADLIDKAPPSSKAHHFAEAVVASASRRRLVKLARSIAVAATDPENDPFSLASWSEQRLREVVTDAAPEGLGVVDARSSMRETAARLIEERERGRVRGAMTGLQCFDRRLGGLAPGKVVVVAGRPSMGKSGLCRAGAYGCARANPDKAVILASVEMGREELDLRTFASLTYEDGRAYAYQDMQQHHPRVGLEELRRIAAFADQAPENLLIADTPVLSLDYVRRLVLGQRKRRPVAAVFIDYLQIMQRPDARGRNEASVIGEITAGLKRLAREAECCVVLLSQLSRQVEQRDNRRPMLSDLRESGSIEQDADAVLFCYREHYYLVREGQRKGQSDFEYSLALSESEALMEVICAKQRGGPVGTDRQRYLATYDVVQNIGNDT